MPNRLPHRSIGALAMVALLAICIQLGPGWSRPAIALPQPNIQRGEWILAIAPGEALRVIGVSNPWARKSAAVQMRFQIVNTYGKPLIEPVEMQVEHGKMAFSDIARGALNHPGEANTGRIQLRIIFEVLAPVGSTSLDFTPLAEVFDLTTGKTTQRTGPIADVLYSAAGNSS